MGLFDDIDPDQFQHSGGILGRLLSLPQANVSQSGGGSDPQSDPYSDNSPQALASSGAGGAQAMPSASDLGTRLGAGLQSWAQTPAGNPFAALVNGINGFNNTQPAAGVAGAAAASASAPQASAQAQPPNFGDRLGTGFQSWAQTPVGSPFAGLANGITGFNTGQVVVAPATAKLAQAQASGNDEQSSGQSNAAPQKQTAPAANSAMNQQFRQLVAIRKRPLWPAGGPRL